MISKTFKVTSETGIHARPATEIVRIAGKYVSEIEVEYNGKQVNAASIMGVLSLGIGFKNTFKVLANGSDAEVAVNEITKYLVSQNVAEVE